MDEPIISTIPQESIKLTKTTKGYTWEIKLLNDEKKSMEIIERIDAYNKELQRRYGNE